MGPLNSRDGVDAYLDAIAMAKGRGRQGRDRRRGNRGQGNFVLPAIVTGLTNDAPIVQHETFAPILYVMPFKSLDEALEMQNAVPQGCRPRSSPRTSRRPRPSSPRRVPTAHRERQHRHPARGDRWRLRRREGDRRRTRVRFGCWKAYMRRPDNTINYSDALPLAQGIKFDL
jgi:aldehyde dehydrogenase (NAD+)